MKKIILNNKTYDAAPMSFNTICALEDHGIALEDMDKKKISFIRAYMAISSGIDEETIGAEIEQHLVNGGTLNDIIEVINKEIEESDFFQALQKDTQAEIGENEKPKKTKEA